MWYLTKEVSDEVHLWHADKHQSFLHVDIIILGVHIQTCLKYPKQQVSISLQYIQKNMGDEVDFLTPYKLKSFSQVDSTTLDVQSQACPKYPK